MALQLEDLAALDAPMPNTSGTPLMIELDRVDEDPEQPRREFNEEALQALKRDDFDLVAKNILFSEPYNFEEQENLIEKAVKLAAGKSEVGLIVIDSITMHYRLTMRDETRREERYGLTRQIAKLLRVSRERGIPVVVTSQVYTDLDTGAYMPLGGHMLSHNAKTIVRFERAGTSTRTVVLEKHRHREEGIRATIRITAQGLED